MSGQTRFAAVHAHVVSAPLRRADANFRSGKRLTEPPPRPVYVSDKPRTSEGIKKKVQKILRKRRKKFCQLSSDDVIEGGLGYLSHSPYEVLLMAGYKLHPWEMESLPKTFTWKKKKNRVAAIKWMVEEKLAKLRKNRNKTPEQIAAALADKHFRKYGIGGLLSHYGASPYKAAHEVYGLLPWEMEHVPYNVVHGRKVEAVLWLEKKTGKPPERLEWDDFQGNRLGCLLTGRKRGSKKKIRHSVYDLVSQAHPEIKPWQMKTIPQNYFRSLQNRLDATRWLVETLKKRLEVLGPCMVIGKHFSRYGMRKALEHHEEGIVSLLRDAGYEIDVERRDRLIRKLREIRKTEMEIGERGDILEKFLRSGAASRLSPGSMATSDFFRNKKTGFMAWYVVVRYYDADPQKALLELNLL